MNPTHDIHPRPTFDKAADRQRYHAEEADRIAREKVEAEVWARQRRNARDKNGEVIRPERLDPGAKAAVERARRKGMMEVTTCVRGTHGRVSHRNS